MLNNKYYASLFFMVFAAAVISIFLLFIISSNSVATVNGEKITAETYKDYLYNQAKSLVKTNPDVKWDEKYSSNKTFEDIFKENTINSLVSIYVVSQEAEKEGIKVNNEDIEKTQKYYPYIKNKELIRKIALVNKFYDLKVRNITSESSEAERYYNEHPEQFITGDIYRIDVKDIETAEAVVKAFLKGGKFEDLAKKYSIDLSSKDKGGFIGNMPLSQYSSVINYDLTRIKENQITEPINRGEYYEIILVKNISKKPFEEVKDYLISWLTGTAKEEKVANTANEILKKAKVEIKWDEVYKTKIGNLK
ncbi:PPIC-type PPIASE domain-containing protein [Thermoanaerobacter thermohydrosulfuricus]|uniref:peptidylprolyl isomerase n=1 Tax=Thermoanaerobacter thermohydrosulfuricus TaxID=1516 RepID=A0A1G7SYY8_THETY|nr:SurA N-terminal domain-containing protein [Thermoanaerobacter thermohydrosulfuricus]SDG27639.1 PPIC-type PPIASE domain-containing protein [Thermoanaerobacter thermohydrosulfuricus]